LERGGEKGGEGKWGKGEERGGEATLIWHEMLCTWQGGEISAQTCGVNTTLPNKVLPQRGVANPEKQLFLFFMKKKAENISLAETRAENV